ncbi:hypothetical protein Tco_0247284 [Tanacetum coccineum]
MARKGVRLGHAATLRLRYLGVPLVTKQINVKDYKPLVENVKAKVWNEVLIMKHLWNVAAKKDTLWVKWLEQDLKDRAAWVTNTGQVTEYSTKTVWKDMCSAGHNERRTRLFKHVKRDEETLVQVIKDIVKLRMMTFIVKESQAVRRMEEI